MVSTKQQGEFTFAKRQKLTRKIKIFEDFSPFRAVKRTVYTSQNATFFIHSSLSFMQTYSNYSRVRALGEYLQASCALRRHDIVSDIFQTGDFHAKRLFATAVKCKRRNTYGGARPEEMPAVCSRFPVPTDGQILHYVPLQYAQHSSSEGTGRNWGFHNARLCFASYLLDKLLFFLPQAVNCEK